MLSTVVSERNRATAYGIMNMASCFAGGTATFAGALLMKSHGLGGLMASGGIMFLVLAILLAITGTLRFQRSAVLKQTIQPS